MPKERTDAPLGLSAAERLRGLSSICRGARMVVFRRTAAGFLVLLAVLLAWQSSPARSHVPAHAAEPVLVAARDLIPGQTLGPQDVAVRQQPADAIPRGALRASPEAVGRVLSGAARSGEALTDVRLTGPELTALSAGDDHSSVPVRLADPAIAELLHPGAHVDLVTVSADSGETSVLARQVPVLAVRPAGEESERGRVIVVAMPNARAAEVAAASLVHSVAVTLR